LQLIEASSDFLSCSVVLNSADWIKYIPSAMDPPNWTSNGRTNVYYLEFLLKGSNGNGIFIPRFNGFHAFQYHSLDLQHIPWPSKNNYADATVAD
jgi:hypothetical protein